MIFFAGRYKIESYKNLFSIPEVLKVKQSKKDGLVFVLSDTLISNLNTVPKEDFVQLTRKTIQMIVRQKAVFNNVEAIVLNGNIIKNAYNPQANQILKTVDFGYYFLKSFISIAGETPIYYVRGDEDTCISNRSIPTDIRGKLNFCNALVLNQTLFIHGHTSQRENNLYCSIDPNKLEDRKYQEEEAKRIKEVLGYNTVMSNMNFDPCKIDSFISSGFFEKVGCCIVNTDQFFLSALME